MTVPLGRDLELPAGRRCSACGLPATPESHSRWCEEHRPFTPRRHLRLVHARAEDDTGTGPARYDPPCAADVVRWWLRRQPDLESYQLAEIAGCSEGAAGQAKLRFVRGFVPRRRIT